MGLDLVGEWDMMNHPFPLLKAEGIKESAAAVLTDNGREHWLAPTEDSTSGISGSNKNISDCTRRAQAGKPLLAARGASAQV